MQSSQSRVPFFQARRAHLKEVQAVRDDNPPTTLEEYLHLWQSFFDQYAGEINHWHRRNAGYHKGIASLARFYIPPGCDVLEIGSGNGDLLAALEPRRGVGLDLSAEMVHQASKNYPHLHFEQMPAERLDLPGQTFDYIILSDTVSYLFDIRLVFERLRQVCHPGTRVVLHWYSKLWRPILQFAENIGLKHPQPLLNWTSPTDIENLLRLADFEVIHQRGHILMPKRIPVFSHWANRYLAHLPGFRWLCLTNWVVARPTNLPPRKPNPRVSVICPCRNEAGNIENIVRRLPDMGSHTELIFVEGHSRDDTLARCHSVAASHPEKDIQVFAQEGVGKGDAVRLGFARATGDILMILDADLSVAPEDLPQFVDVLTREKGEFVNGSRLVYGMEPKAMRFLNLLGNKAFAVLLSNLIGQPVKDTLCGTKVLFREDYEKIARNRSYFGDFDPFGDFDLLFGAAKSNLRIAEIPVRYRQRTYGTTNISRFTHGWLLFRMCFAAAKKLFFID